MSYVGTHLSDYVLNKNVDVAGIDTDLANKALSIMHDLEDKGWEPRIGSGMRTVAEEAYHLANHTSQTMHSKHLTGHALDIVDKRYAWGGPASKLNFTFWFDLGAAAKKYGVEWGGSWHWKDVAHIQN